MFHLHNTLYLGVFSLIKAHMKPDHQPYVITPKYCILDQTSPFGPAYVLRRFSAYCMSLSGPLNITLSTCGDTNVHPKLQLQSNFGWKGTKQIIWNMMNTYSFLLMPIIRVWKIYVIIPMRLLPNVATYLTHTYNLATKSVFKINHKRYGKEEMWYHILINSFVKIVQICRLKDT